MIRSVRRVASVALLAVLGASVACSGGEPTAVPPDRALAATRAWSRPTPPTAERAVAYLTLHSDRVDTVVGVEVPTAVAAAASLHRTMVHDEGGSHHGGGGTGEMHMEPVGSLPVGPTEPLVFEPGGNHVMLEGLAAPLRRGERFELTLELGSGRRVVVPVLVADEAPGVGSEG